MVVPSFIICQYLVSVLVNVLEAKSIGHSIYVSGSLCGNTVDKSIW